MRSRGIGKRRVTSSSTAPADGTVGTNAPDTTGTSTISSRVDVPTLGVASCAVDGLDELVLGVALDEAQAMTGSLGLGRQPGMDVSQGLGPIVFGLAGAEQVQVGAVEDEDVGHLHSSE